MLSQNSGSANRYPQETGEELIRRILLPKFDLVRKVSGGWVVRCPAPGHGKGGGDRNPSLSISAGADQPVVIHCFALCEPADVLAAIGLTGADLCSGELPAARAINPDWTPFGDATAVYSYTDEHGEILYQHVRTADKQFPYRVADPAMKRGWRYKAAMDGVRRVPYRLPAILSARPLLDVIWYVEGERDVHTLEAHGEIATTTGNAGSWLPEYAPYFDGLDVLIIADRDKPGYSHAADAAAGLEGHARFSWVVEAREGKDATDHFAAGYGVTDFIWHDMEEA